MLQTHMSARVLLAHAQEHFQSAADHLLSQFKQLQLQQQQQSELDAGLANSSNPPGQLAQEEQLQQAKARWNELQVCQAGSCISLKHCIDSQEVKLAYFVGTSQYLTSHMWSASSKKLFCAGAFAVSGQNAIASRQCCWPQ